MKYLVLFLLSISLTFLYAAEERELICQTGPGMYGKYRQTPMHQTIRVHFKKQNVSHANKKVGPGFCSFPLAGMGKEWSNELFLSVDNPRDTLLALHISPSSINMDYKAMNNRWTINNKIKAMIKMLHHKNQRYIIRAVHKKVDGKWVWKVKSIGWNNTL
jgi:hypothetical protein